MITVTTFNEKEVSAMVEDALRERFGKNARLHIELTGTASVEGEPVVKTHKPKKVVKTVKKAAKRGRPAGKAKKVVSKTGKPRGRPKGSTNKPKVAPDSAVTQAEAVVAASVAEPVHVVENGEDGVQIRLGIPDEEFPSINSDEPNTNIVEA